jgi:RNA polymerase sigma-54 factor
VRRPHQKEPQINDTDLRLDLHQDLYAHQEMRQKVSARLVQASAMLQLTGLALHEAIVQELVDNPALEAEEVATCAVCGTPLHGSVCPTCLRAQRPETEADAEEWRSSGETVNGMPADDDFDPLSRAAGRETLAERLIRDLGAMLPRQDRRIVEQLVCNLDERGYLDISVDEVAETLGVDLGRVEAVLTALQSMEPVGVGARDLRECLLIQVDHLAAQGITCRLVREIVSDHLTELGGRKFERIARALRASVPEVQEAAAFVRARLNPFPAQGHAGPEAMAEARSAHVVPDVAFVPVEGGFEVEVVEARRFRMRVSETYVELARSSSGLASEDRAHVRQYTGRAQLFLASIAQRRATMKKVAECIGRAQAGFLRHGVKELVPLTRSQIAVAVGLDESTVSRATNGKYALLPNGQVVAFDTFFTPALVTHAVMRDILAEQGHGPALSDQQISQVLASRGIHIARRTVAKYRNQMGVSPAAIRPESGPRAA